jgi:hypothetical protein
VLKYSYVYAYFLPEEGVAKELFNFLQQDLEKTIEQLNELLESPTAMLRKAEAVDLTKVAQIKKDNLLKGIENDLDFGLDPNNNNNNNNKNNESENNNNNNKKDKKRKDKKKKSSKNSST